MRVRVLAIFVAAMALVSGPAFAQAVTGNVKVGVNFASVKFAEGTEEASTGWKPGLAIGAGVDVPITEMFSFQPEVLYSMKGGKGGEAFDDDDENKLKIDQVQIPILFKASFSTATVRPYVVFGPGIGFTAKAKFQQSGEVEEDIKDDVEKVDFSGIIGGGVQFGRGSLEIRYDHGFRDLDKDTDGEAKLKTVTFLLGVSF